MLVDSHCHLDKCQDWQAAVQRAKEGGVNYMQTIATDLSQISNLLAIAASCSGVFVSAGIHPCSVNEHQTSAEELLAIASDPKIIAFGETGLDYYHPGYDKKKQQVSFTEHIQASQSMHLPIIVHNRSSDGDCAQILNSEQQNSPFTGLIHCFASDVAFARKVLDIGFYISIAGIITFNNAQNLVEVVKYTPLDRLLIETDSPYLAPIPMRGKANEPAFVAFVAAKIAEIKNIALSQVIQTTGDNFFNLFSKATR